VLKYYTILKSHRENTKTSTERIDFLQDFSSKKIVCLGGNGFSQAEFSFFKKNCVPGRPKQFLLGGVLHSSKAKFGIQLQFGSSC
jgi:hypothetical protein